MPEPDAPHAHYAIVLAAGFSTRMGRCKATLPWLDGTSLLTYQVQQLLFAGITPIVVLGQHNLDRQPDLSGSQVVLNPHSGLGKTSSILAGVGALPSEFATLTLSAVDQPRPSWVYQTLVQAHLSAPQVPITAPNYQGRLGHPLVVGKALLPQLQQLQEETAGLRHLVTTVREQIQRVEFDTAIVLLDINTHDRYQAALAEAIASRSPTDY